MLQTYSLQLYCMEHHGVTLLGILTRQFSDCENFILPLQRTVMQPITFVLVIPDKTTKTTCASANLRPMTKDKPFPGFDIIRVLDQNTFGGFGVKIPMNRSGLLKKIKI